MPSRTQVRRPVPKDAYRLKPALRSDQLGELAEIVDHEIGRVGGKSFGLKTVADAAGADVRIARRADVDGAVAYHHRRLAGQAAFREQFLDADRVRFFSIETVAAIDAEEMIAAAEPVEDVVADPNRFLCNHRQTHIGLRVKPVERVLDTGI